MTRKYSEIEKLFFELYGYYPPKNGQAYEMIVAAAFKLLLNRNISYNQNISGIYSNTNYQLDALVNNNQMVEVKDYTIHDKKVGRGDLQKMQGALTELPVDGGLFASATDYTMPAKKYAQSTAINPLHKPIELYNIRPSTLEDENGRLKKIVVDLRMCFPDFEMAKFDPIFTDISLRDIKRDLEGQSIKFSIDSVLDKHGEVLITVEELTYNNQPSIDMEDEPSTIEGCMIIRDGHILIQGKLYEILGFKYNVPIRRIKREIVIQSEGQYKLFVKGEDGKINKLISDADLKKVRFENGKVIS
ncbi:MAG: restriction endonuclease [Flavipsychrobacter sp.]